MRKGSIEAVTFDLWNTLIVDREGGGKSRADRRIREILIELKESGLSFSREQVEEAYWTTQREFEEVRKRGCDTRFEIQLDDFLNAIEDDLVKALSAPLKKRIAEHHLNAYLEDPPVLMPGALEVLETLTGSGYRLGLICNSGTTPGSLQRKFLADVGIASYMKVMTFSDEEGLAKPSAGIFLKTLCALGVEAPSALHIGDRPETDVLGAKSIGMKAVLFGGAPWDGLPVTPDAQVHHLSELPEVLRALDKNE